MLYKFFSCTSHGIMFDTDSTLLNIVGMSAFHFIGSAVFQLN